MTDLSEYDILEKQAVSKADWDFSRALDSAIAAENDAYTATLCQKCSGTGSLWRAPTGGSVSWTKHICSKCFGTGER